MPLTAPNPRPDAEGALPERVVARPVDLGDSLDGLLDARAAQDSLVADHAHDGETNAVEAHVLFTHLDKVSAVGILKDLAEALDFLREPREVVDGRGTREIAVRPAEFLGQLALRLSRRTSPSTTDGSRDQEPS